jgi:hypothetical protein
VHGVSIDDMLEMYALFKQAKFGDNNTCERGAVAARPPARGASSRCRHCLGRPRASPASSSRAPACLPNSPPMRIHAHDPHAHAYAHAHAPPCSQARDV